MFAWKVFSSAFITAALLLVSCFAFSEISPGSMDVHWNEGAEDCKANSQPPIQVHAYNPQTYILRENLCSTFEAPFMYLVIGSKRALLIDTGDVSDPAQMPVRDTAMHLLPKAGTSALPLLVAHSHRHADHRAGDSQFANLKDVQVIGFDLDSVRQFYGFKDWPSGVSQIDLGDRILDVIPAPGHNPTCVVFYDRDTGLLFTGDFLLPGRLLVDDTNAYIASANRVADFVKDRPVSYVLGGHIEFDSSGNTLPWESQYHPHEHVLQLTKDDVLALPAALRSFNGFYSTSGQFVMMNPMRNLIAFGVMSGLILVALLWALISYIRRWRRSRNRTNKTLPESGHLPQTS